MTQMVAEALQVPATYVGHVDDFGDESEDAGNRRPVIRYPFAFPSEQLELMNNQILSEGSGVTWRALNPVAVTEQTSDENGAVGEGEEAGDAEAKMELQPVLIDEVMDCEDIVFHGMTQLGSYAAIPLVYSSALSVEGLSAARQAILEQRAQKTALEAALAEKARITAEKEAARLAQKEELQSKVTEAQEQLDAALEELKEEENTEGGEPDHIVELRETLQNSQKDLEDFLNPAPLEGEEAEEEDVDELPTVVTDVQLLESLPRTQIRNVISIDSLGSSHAIRSTHEVSHATAIANKIAELVKQREDAALMEQALWELSTKPAELISKFDEASEAQKTEQDRIVEELRASAIAKALEKAKNTRDILKAHMSTEEKKRKEASKSAAPAPLEGEADAAAVDNVDEAPAEAEDEEINIHLTNLTETALDKASELKVVQNTIENVVSEIMELKNVRVVNPVVEETLYLAYTLALAHGGATQELSAPATEGLQLLRNTPLFLQGSTTRLDSVNLRLLITPQVLALLSNILVTGPRVYSDENFRLVNIQDRLTALQQMIEEHQAELNAAREDDDEFASQNSYDAGSHPAAAVLLRFVQAAVTARAADVNARKSIDDDAKAEYDQQKSDFDSKLEDWEAEKDANAEKREQLAVDLAVAEGAEEANNATGDEEEGEEGQRDQDASRLEELRKDLRDLEFAHSQLLLKEPIPPIKPKFDVDDDIERDEEDEEH
eukprot:GDKJ01023598.1.p1 GENE.GDKJ01023598.1~~GDKJ01023598.1.p1  ORF type:complete len:837 (+),score=279.27 GDKJ01023598.1:340-2511(+)